MPSCGHNPSRVDERGRAFKGSQLQVQIYVNRRVDELNGAILKAIPALAATGHITWTSPLESDQFLEYRDASFLKKLHLEESASELREFWPKRGPCWDALAFSSGSPPSAVLIEGKSYPDEAESARGAKDEQSIHMIDAALRETRQWLSLTSYDAEAWTKSLYQTANRLAHLHFLRNQLGVQAWLLYLCVVNDPIQPTSTDEWETGVAEMWQRLGLRSNPPYTAQVFLQARSRNELLVPRPRGASSRRNLGANRSDQE